MSFTKLFTINLQIILNLVLKKIVNISPVEAEILGLKYEEAETKVFAFFLYLGHNLNYVTK